MRQVSRHVVATGLCLLLAACATARPLPPPRAATDADKLAVARALVPLLRAAGLWRGPQDGCAAALGVVPTRAINLGVTPHPTCKFALFVTEGALDTLSPRDLQAALAHELGHVQLGHFAARQARRQAEQRTDEAIGSTGAVGGAVGAAIPLVGPIVAAGMMGAQMIAHATAMGAYRAYDREEEAQADRFAASLLEKVEPGRCRALVDLFARMQREADRPPWAYWLGTHPSPGARLEEAGSACPS